MAGRDLPARMAATLTLPVFERLAPPHANPALNAVIEASMTAIARRYVPPFDIR